jgi:hypothetical protein
MTNEEYASYDREQRRRQVRLTTLWSAVIIVGLVMTNCLPGVLIALLAPFAAVSIAGIYLLGIAQVGCAIAAAFCLIGLICKPWNR